MFEIAYSNVAVVTKETPDVTTGMAMVDVEVPFATRIRRATDRTLAVLLGEKFFVSAERDAIGRFQLVILGKSWVFRSPSSTSGRVPFLVVLYPFARMFRTAFSTASLKLIEGTTSKSEAGSRQNSLTKTALFLNTCVGTGSRHLCTPLLA